MVFQAPNLNEELKTSKFNEAIFQMQRIHNLQESLHIARARPLQFFVMNEFTSEGLYGYEIMISSAEGHFIEVLPKLTDTEEIEANKLRRTVNNFIIDNPIFETYIDEVRHIKIKKANKENWKRFREILFEYEGMMRKLFNKHKMTSPDEDESSLF